MTLDQYNKNTTIYAVYEKKSTPPPTPTYTITLNTSPTEGGYITKNSSSTGAITSDTYKKGEHFQFYARPNSGYTFVKWVGTGGYETTDNPPSVGYADRNETWTAYFRANTYVLSYSKSRSDAVGTVPSSHPPTSTKVTLKTTDLRVPAGSETTSYKITFTNPYGSNGTQTKSGSIVQAYVYAFAY